MVDRSDETPDRGDERRLLAAIDAALESAGPASDERSALDDLRARCAAALAAPSAADEARARRVERAILARTTREDLSLRRDLGLVLDFFTGRLRESALLRIVAAAVLVHVTLVPLVAYHLVGEAERPQLTIHLSQETLDDLEEDLPRRDPNMRLVDGDDAPEVDLSPLPIGALEAADALSDGARAWLGRLELPPPTTDLGHVLEAASADVAAGRATRSTALVQLLGELELVLGELEPGEPAPAGAGDGWIDWIADGLARVDAPGPLVSAWLAAARAR